jgi:hypothetical protein
MIFVGTKQLPFLDEEIKDSAETPLCDSNASAYAARPMKRTALY